MWNMSFSLIKALDIGFKVHLNNPGWFYLIILNLITLQDPVSKKSLY